MYQLPADAISTLRPWFQPDRLSHLVGWHVIQTGNGTGWVDRWPEPQVVLVESAGNYLLVGNPAAITPASLRPLILGFVNTSASFVPLLHTVFPDLQIWERIVYVLDQPPQEISPPGITIRRLEAADAERVAQISPNLVWIAKTWGGPAGLACSGYAWGAFVGEQIVAIASSFFVGIRYEEIGVVTEATYRGQGLSGACAGALCQEIHQRGRQPIWSTSPDNQASIRVAEKLGFRFVQDDRLYVCGIAIPASATRPG